MYRGVEVQFDTYCYYWADFFKVPICCTAKIQIGGYKLQATNYNISGVSVKRLGSSDVTHEILWRLILIMGVRNCKQLSLHRQCKLRAADRVFAGESKLLKRIK